MPYMYDFNLFTCKFYQYFVNDFSNSLSLSLVACVQLDKVELDIEPDSIFNKLGECGLIGFSDYIFLLTVLSSKYKYYITKLVYNIIRPLRISYIVTHV